MKAIANSKMRLIFLHVRSTFNSSHAMKFVFGFCEQTFSPGRYIEQWCTVHRHSGFLRVTLLHLFASYATDTQNITPSASNVKPGSHVTSCNVNVKDQTRYSDCRALDITYFTVEATWVLCLQINSHK